jgi:hypothetical protein
MAETIQESISCDTQSIVSRFHTPIKHLSLQKLPEDEGDAGKHEDDHSGDDNKEPEPSRHSDNDVHCQNTVESEVAMANK